MIIIYKDMNKKLQNMLEETLTKNMHLQKVRDHNIQSYEQETTEYVRRNTHQEYAFTKGKGNLKNIFVSP